MEILFEERQRFNQIIFWIALAALTLLFCFAAIQQIFFHHPFGNKPMSDRALISSVIFLFFVDILFLNFKLKTQVASEAIIIKLTPFHIFPKVFVWSQLSEVNVRKINPITEYGGWGLRGFGKNKELAIKSKWAIELVFLNGQSLLIGTQQPEKMKEVIGQARSIKSS